MNKIQEYWDLVVQVWNDGVFGVDIGRIIVAVLILMAALFVRRLFARFVTGRLLALAKRTKTDVDVQIVEALDGPMEFIPVTIGIFLAADYMAFDAGTAAFADNLVRSFIAFTIFWALYNVIEPISFLFKKMEKVLTKALVSWLIKALKAAVLLVGAAAILEMWGIQVGPILAGLGLFGVAVALGAQDMFKNLISGILILAERRFQAGDWIKVDGVVEGTVEDIGFRSTLVRRFDKAPVYVPNTKLSDNAVTNFTAMTHRRIYWKIGVVYSTTVDQLRQIRDGIETYLAGNKDFAEPPEVARFVRIDAFNDSSIDIMIYTFTKTTNWGEWLEIKEAFAYAIKEIVAKAGSEFAYPSQSLYVESLPGEKPEVFVPPTKAKPRKKATAKAVGSTESASADGGA